MSSPSSNQSTNGDIPEGVARIAAVMSTYPAAWSLCGGWAVDAWLGRQSRDHGDIDISVFVQDQGTLFDHLREWQLLAHDAAWEPGGGDQWWDGRRRLGFPSHIHARPPELSGAVPERGIATLEDGFILDIQVDDQADEDWVLHSDPRISVPLQDAVQTSPWGMPTASPDVLLFFKARDLRRRDKADFEALMPQLPADRRSWLRGAISRLGHPWVARLSA